LAFRFAAATPPLRLELREIWRIGATRAAGAPCRQAADVPLRALDAFKFAVDVPAQMRDESD
jgi:hypothetical protein